MIKKSLLILALAFGLNWACQKDCTEYKQYRVPSVMVAVNSANKGINISQPKNVGDTIRSLSNQFYFYPSVEYLSYKKVIPGFSIASSVYAGDCPVLDLSVTSFSAPLTQVFMDVNFPAGLYGIAPNVDIEPGVNLLGYADIKNMFFSNFLENREIFSGYAAPISISPQFFKHLKGQRINFVFGFITTEGLNRNDTVSAYIDVNI
jgi:hypothetical protein